MFQIAADGAWETATIIETAGAVARVAELARDDLAIEVMWPGQAFVGVRWPVAEYREATAALARAALCSAPAHNYLVALLVPRQPGNDPDFIELGAVNAWRSVGPEVLWRRGEPFSADLIETALARFPRLAASPHPIAVEYAATTPRPCWVGVIVG